MQAAAKGDGNATWIQSGFQWGENACGARVDGMLGSISLKRIVLYKTA
jgi:hypothetical protein